jgi:adenosylhomocysteine nucleosidase
MCGIIAYIGKNGGIQMVHDGLIILQNRGYDSAGISSITPTSILCHKFAVSHIIFIGVAGSADHNLNIGDIVIADKLYQHDMDARPLAPLHEIPPTGKTFFYRR